MNFLKKGLLLGLGAFAFIYSSLKSSNQSTSYKTKVKSNTMNTNSEEAIYLFLRRREREPIRESFYRTYTYIVKNNTLYSKTYAYGRFSQNFTEYIALSPNQIQQLKTALKKAEIYRNFELNKPEDNSNEQLSYKINLETSTEKYEQKMNAPGNYYYEHHPEIGDLWRLIANFQQSENLPSEEVINQTPTLQVDLTIKEIYPSKDTERKIRNYALSGNQLTITHSRTGVYREKKEHTLELSPLQLFNIHQLLVREKKHLNVIIDTKTNFQNRLFRIPNLECSLEAQFENENRSTQIKATQYEALEIPSFIVIEYLEGLLDEKRETHEHFEEGLRNKKRAAAELKFKHLRKN